MESGSCGCPPAYEKERPWFGDLKGSVADEQQSGWRRRVPTSFSRKTGANKIAKQREKKSRRKRRCRFGMFSDRDRRGRKQLSTATSGNSERRRRELGGCLFGDISSGGYTCPQEGRSQIPRTMVKRKEKAEDVRRNRWQMAIAV